MQYFRIFDRQSQRHLRPRGVDTNGYPRIPGASLTPGFTSAENQHKISHASGPRGGRYGHSSMGTKFGGQWRPERWSINSSHTTHPHQRGVVSDERMIQVIHQPSPTYFPCHHIQYDRRTGLSVHASALPRRECTGGDKVIPH